MANATARGGIPTGERAGKRLLKKVARASRASRNGAAKIGNFGTFL
jgi:hypothetical protein